jgi:sporulation protein YtfJ
MVEKNELTNLMHAVMGNLQQMVDVNTIVGESVESKDGTVILPISKVSFGFVAGGGEYSVSNKKDEMELPFAGGSGAGVSLQPVAFMVVGQDNVRLLSVNQNSLYDRIIDSVPVLFDKVVSSIKDCKKPSDEEYL